MKQHRIRVNYVLSNYLDPPKVEPKPARTTEKKERTEKKTWPTSFKIVAILAAIILAPYALAVVGTTAALIAAAFIQYGGY